MSELTLIQLLDNARRQRAEEAARQWTTSDWLALPVIAVFVMVIVAWVLVAAVANATQGLFLPPISEAKCKQTDQQTELLKYADQGEL